MANIITALVLVCVVSAARGDFVSDANDILEKATRTLGIDTCVDKARKKGNSVGENGKMKVAISLVNLYTQACPVNAGVKFYSALNDHLSGRPSSASGFDYSKFGKLLNDAMAILKLINNEKTYAEVYRGQCGIHPIPGTTYRPNRFFSTTTSPDEAFGSSCFIVVRDADGLSIQHYSEFPTEYEVLIRYTATYKVENSTNDSSEIKKVLEPLGVNHAYTQVIVLRQQPFTCPLRRRRSTSNNECHSSISVAVKPFYVLYVLSVASLLITFA